MRLKLFFLMFILALVSVSFVYGFTSLQGGGGGSGDVTNNTFELFTQERINASRINASYIFLGKFNGDGLFLKGTDQQICFTPDCNSYLAAGTGDVMFMVADGFTRMAWTPTGTRLHSLVYPASDRGVSIGNTTHRLSRLYVGNFLNESGVGIFTNKLILNDVNLTEWSQVNKTNSTYFSNDTWIDKYPPNHSAAHFDNLDVGGGSTAGTHLLTVDADASGFSARFDGTVGIRVSPTDATALGVSFNNVESTAVTRITADNIMQLSASNLAGFGHGIGVRTQAAITSTTAGMRSDIQGGVFNARLQTDTNFTSSLVDMTGGKFEVDTTGSLNVGTIDTATAGHFKVEPVNGLFKTIRGLFVEAFVITGMVSGGANTVYGLYISDLTGVPSNAVSGNIPTTVHSVFIEAMDGDNRGIDMGNFLFQGGGFNSGHLVFSGLGGSHLFANLTDSSFRISANDLTGPDDYDLLIKSDHATFSGDINVTGIGNSTFSGDVEITGKLFGGSPVRIDGINITEDNFFLTDNINNSLKFILKNLHGGINATAVITAENDVGGTMSIGIGSSDFKIGIIPRPNVTALFSRSRGLTVFANLFNQGFVWEINTQDDNDPVNLVRMMTLNSTGLHVDRNLTVSEVIILPNSYTITSKAGAIVLRRDASGAVGQFGIQNLEAEASDTSGASYITIQDCGNYTVDAHSSLDTRNPNQTVHHLRGCLFREVWRTNSDVSNTGFSFEKGLDDPVFQIDTEAGKEGVNVTGNFSIKSFNSTAQANCGMYVSGDGGVMWTCNGAII